MKKNKDIIEEIKKEVDNFQIKDLKEQILNNVNHEVVDKKPYHKKNRVYKPFIIGFVSLTLFVFAFVYFYNRNLITPQYKNISDLPKEQQIYFTHMSSLVNLAYMDNNQNTLDINAEISYQKISDTIHQYINFVEGLNNKDNYKYAIMNSDLKEYEYKMEIFIPSLYSYYIYYNENILDYKLDNDEDEKEDEEIESSLTGLIIIDEKRYKVYGSKEIENDESSIYLKIIISDNEYFEVTQEIESDEKSYEYQKFINEKLVESLEIETEIDEEIDIKIKIDKKLKDMIILEFNFLNNKYICKYKDKDNNLKINIEFNHDKVIYVFPDNVYITKEN